MKKFASLMLAGALYAGLATTAFAESCTFTDENGNPVVTYDNVLVTEETVEFGDWDMSETFSKDVIMFIAMPDFSATLAEGRSEYLQLFDNYRLENGCIASGGGYDWYTASVITIDDLFFGSKYDPSTGEYLGDGYKYDYIYHLGTDNETGKEVWLKMWDGTEIPAASGTYTAVKYDTWGQIALNNYGSYGAWKQLYKANNYVKLTEGTQITLPETLGKYTRIGAPVAKEGESLYTVKAGETLGTIAAAKYGDLMQYKAIFERNADRLKNANTIYEGQVIVLPVIQ